ncbi:MAG: isopenicillin N synthase family dioxygenase [Actinomycetota bacterium]
MKLATVDIAALHGSTENASYAKAAGELFAALSEIGFAVIVNHGVDQKTIDEMRKAVEAVFASPREILMRDMVVKGNYRGFVPLGYFTPNSGKGNADQYEAWKLHNETALDDPICAACALYGPNIWPRIDTDIRTPVMNYWRALTRLSEVLIVAVCSKLAINPATILSCMTNPLTNMTLLNYPPTPPQDDTWGIHPHKDFNLLTLLAHDPIGGLEVRDRSENWINADCPPEGMVLNVGDMLELWSGGRLVSTPHRVLNKSGKARQSFPFFSKPRFDVVVEPLLEPISGFNRLPLHVGTSAADIWYSNWPDTASTNPAQELGNYNSR